MLAEDAAEVLGVFVADLGGHGGYKLGSCAQQAAGGFQAEEGRVLHGALAGVAAKEGWLYDYMFREEFRNLDYSVSALIFN